MTDLSKWNPFRFDRRSERRTSDNSDKSGGQQLQRRESWQDPFERMENQMNQLMRGFFGNDFWTPGLRSTSQQPSFFGDFTPTRFSPSVDITDEKNHVVVTAELPGLDKGDVEVTLDDNVLMLKGEKRHEREGEEDGCYRTERFFGSFKRTVPLPGDVDTESAEAGFDNGVLTVRFPKVEGKERGPKRLEF